MRAGCRKDGAVYKQPLWTPRSISFLKNMLSHHIQSFTPLISIQKTEQRGSYEAKLETHQKRIRTEHPVCTSFLFLCTCLRPFSLWVAPSSQCFLNVHGDVEVGCDPWLPPDLCSVSLWSDRFHCSPCVYVHSAAYLLRCSSGIQTWAFENILEMWEHRADPHCPYEQLS